LSTLAAQTVDSSPRALAVFTVGTLPTASSWANKMALVTDGSAAGDCTVGSGSTRVLCVSNGSAWAAVGGSGGANLLHAQVPITSAQIKTLNASPVTIVAAPGSGKMLQFVSGSVEIICSSCTAYTSGGSSRFQYSNGDAVSPSYSAGNFLAGPTTTAQWQFLPTADGGSSANWPNDERNTSIVFANWQGPEYATGTGTLLVDIWYTVASGL